MQAKISIERMGRIRKVRFNDLFVGNDPKGEVRAQWSSLYQSLHRNQFEICLDMKQVTSGGKEIDEATRDFTDMFDRMENWCNANCTGIWTVWDNEEELDQNATEVTIEVQIMFEHEEDLMRFIKDCALIAKLTY